MGIQHLNAKIGDSAIHLGTAAAPNNGMCTQCDRKKFVACVFVQQRLGL